MKRILAVVITLSLLAFRSPALGETALRDALGTWEGEPYTNSFLGIGGTYTNSFLGLGCTLSNWYYSSEEGILDVNHLTKEKLGDDLKNVIKAAKTVAVMIAFADPSGTPNVSIQLTYAHRDIEQSIQKTGVAETLSFQLGYFRKSYESGGAENVKTSLSTVSIDGRDEAALIVHYSMGDVSYTAVEAVLDYDGILARIVVNVTGDREDEAEEMFSSFFWLNEPSQ